MTEIYRSHTASRAGRIGALVVALMLGLSASSVAAMNAFSGWASPLGTTVRTSGRSGVYGQVSGPFVNTNQSRIDTGTVNAVIGSVYNIGTTTIASIFDQFGQPIPNPFYVRIDGSFVFYAPSASYDLRFTIGVQGIAPVAVGLGVNPEDYGAVCDDVSDDTTAISAATSAAVAAGLPVLFPSGTCLTTLQSFTSGGRTVWRGKGRGLTTIKVNGSSGTAIAATWTHLTNEWYGELSDLTLNGNAGAGPLVSVNGATLAVMRDVTLTNVTGTALKLVSTYDSHFENVYVETCGDSTHPCVVLDTNGSGADGFNNNQFYNLHIEPGDRDAILLDMIGNATNAAEENWFFGLKTHGDSATSNPARPLVRLGAYSKNNRFFGLIAAFGKGTSQVEIDGDGNQFYGPVLGLGGTAPQCAFDLIGNYNRIVDALPKNTTYSTTYFRNSGNENLVMHPRIGGGGPAVYADTGQFHIEYRDPTTTYHYIYDTQGQKFAAGLYLGFFGSTPVTRQASGADLANNVTVGGVNDTIANYTDLVTYATDAVAIRNDIYQLSRKLKQLNDALRKLGLVN